MSKKSKKVDLVIEAAKLYKDLLDEISPKLHREIGETAAGAVESWSDFGIIVDEPFIAGLLIGIAFAESLAPEDSFAGILKQVGITPPNRSTHVATFLAARVAYDFVLEHDPAVVSDD